MNERKKQRISETFDAIAQSYDQLRFIQVTARRVVELAPLGGGMNVLDVATGTGLVAAMAAEKVGAAGRVVGVDISSGMLDQARQHATEQELVNLQFVEGDAERLDFADASFDAVLCASSLFLIPAMDTAVKEWFRVLRSGGFAFFSSFGDGLLGPYNRLWNSELEVFGIGSTTPPQLLAEPRSCHDILAGAGFSRIDVRSERLDYRLGSSEEWWGQMASSMDGLALRQLDGYQRGQVKQRVLDAMSDAEQGFPVEVPANFATGWKL